MNCYKKILGGCLLAFLFSFSFGAQATVAQEEPQPPPDSPPKPAARTSPIPVVLAGEENQNPNQDPNALQPDFTPLTGLLDATLGLPEIRHSYWVPGLQYGANIQSNSFSQPNSSSWYVDNYLIGNVSLLEAWPRSTLAVNYSGGGYFSTRTGGGGNSNYQQLALSQTYHGDRWLIQISDSFSYLPQTSFGFGGGTNLGAPGVGGSLEPTTPGLGTGYIPNQSIFAGVGPRYSNAAALQATYSLSTRSSVTVSGAYGILHFLDPGNVDSNSITGGVGYNYAMSREDTIGLAYYFSSYHYPDNPQAYGNHVATISYGRKITGRLALRLSGGPQITTFRLPIGGSSRQVGGYINSNLTYGLRDGSISAGYVHSLSGGSGVLIGSTLDQVNLSVSRRLNRVWTGNINFGYAHNGNVTSLALANVPTYNSWFAGGGIARPIGRNLNIAAAYTASIGSSTLQGCVSSCTTSNTYQTVTVNVQWHTRPFVLP